MSDIGIGSTVYVRCGDGRESNKQWHPHQIVGETRVSWEIPFTQWKKLKFPKKPDERGEYHTSEVQRGYGGYRVFLTKVELDNHLWKQKNSRRIAHRVEFGADVATLRKVAELVGYQEEA